MVVEDVLQTILERADGLDSTFDADEINQWPAGTLDHFIELGLIKPDTNRQSVVCDACTEGHLEEVNWVRDKKRKLRGYITCPDAGLVEVSTEWLKCWVIDFDTLVDQIAADLSLTGKQREIVTGRVWRLGSKKVGAATRVFYLMRGLAWSDGAMVAEKTPRPKLSIVFVPDRLPSSGIWSNATPAIVALSTVSSLSQQGIEIDRASVEANLIKSHRKPRLTLGTNNVATLDGKGYSVTGYQAHALLKLIEAHGNWVPGHELANDEGKPHRIDRILFGNPVSKGKRKNGLPKPILSIVESKPGTGYRITIFD